VRVETIIVTYKRPKMCERLIAQLNTATAIHQHRHDPDFRNYLGVIHDGPTDYWLDGTNEYRYTPKHHGRDKWWQIVNTIFKAQEVSDWEYFYFLPDDVTIQPDFFEKTIEAFDKISCYQKVCLNLLNDGRAGKRQWTDHMVVDWRDYDAWDIGWVDMAFMANRQFFAALDYEVREIYRNADECASTGV